MREMRIKTRSMGKTFDAQKTLELIRRGGLDNLLVDVSAQGMAYADFLEYHGVHFRRVRWDAAAAAFRPITSGSAAGLPPAPSPKRGKVR